ncbi:hypothetical protein CP980_34995 [Streptomyces vinaceus]|uniref:Uncharacterized protein n=2 Tax=Streptomyces vinaceus TaxID=1960 RepID=A0A5J6JHJ1_STRVI|nr:hypothetical protein CP980_34995 [Streptomyces vinaceus]
MMVVAVAPADLDLLDALVAEQQDAERRWQASAEDAADIPHLRGAALRAARARIRAERDQRRDDGRHRVTRWRALAPALRVELEAAGMLREWEPVPAGAAQAGQTLGGTGPGGGQGLTGRLCVTLPDTLAVPLHRGVYWTNEPHVTALDAWTERWGTWPHSRATPQALDERARLIGQITTTGTLLRTALKRTLESR